MQAHEIMTRRPVSGTPEMPLRLAQTVRRRGRFRHLPILEAGRLRGVLSDRDLRRLAAVLEACAAPLLLPPVSGAGADRPRGCASPSAWGRSIRGRSGRRRSPPG